MHARYKIAGVSLAPEPVPEAEPVVVPETDSAVVPETDPAIPLPLPTPTASEGTHPLAVSPEEGLFAVPQEKVVAQCQKLLKLKYTAMITYANYGDRLRAHYRDSIYAHFNEHMGEEREDAYHLTMKITALGGEPTPRVATISDVNDLHQIFLTLLQMEQALLQELRVLSQMAGENIGLRATVDQMALTDSQHADDLRRMMYCEEGKGGNSGTFA